MQEGRLHNGFLVHLSEVMLNNYVMFFLKKPLSKVDRRGIASRYYGLTFQKAFDKVPHQRLQLRARGIGDSIIDWIEQWLNDRRQRVVVDGEV